MTLRVKVILSVETFIKASEIELDRIRQVVYLVVNFSCWVKLIGPSIVTLIAHSIDMNFCGSRDGVVIRALASQQCDLRFDSWTRCYHVDQVCGWFSSLLKTDTSKFQFDLECSHVWYMSLWLRRSGNHSSCYRAKINWFDFSWWKN